MIHTSMFQKHIHKAKFYPSADDFTQALLVMLVTNIMSEQTLYRGYGKIYPDTAKAKKYQRLLGYFLFCRIWFLSGRQWLSCWQARLGRNKGPEDKRPIETQYRTHKGNLKSCQRSSTTMAQYWPFATNRSSQNLQKNIYVYKMSS